MTDLFLSNSLTRKKERFVPVTPGRVGIYSCGPTVYWNQHIGNMYAYVQWDSLVRLLRYLGYEVKWVMNITDVGHMTSDEDTGEDKMEKGAKREGVSVWDLAETYIAQFQESVLLLNISPPDVLPRATEHIEEQINLIKLIEANGLTYKTKMGLVYDTAKFPGYAKFGQLNLKSLKPRQDVEEDKEKKRPWDFLLWVTGNPKHIMQWESPWGKGYPGWHIECTAMSTKYLGETFDIHTGGIEHIPVHHTNEIAQGFAAFGHKTANYWLHNAWLTEKGGVKLSKSLGNFVTVQDLVKKGYDPLAMRYLILTSHYKKGLNFSWTALDSAARALENLREIVRGLIKNRVETRELSPEKMQKIRNYQVEFSMALADDLNCPQALAVFWQALKSNLPAVDKYDLILNFDEVLGLNLAKLSSVDLQLSDKVAQLVEAREKARKENNFDQADRLRKQIEGKGYLIEDTSAGPKLKKISK